MGALLTLLKIGMVFGLLAAVLFVLKRTDSLGTRARGGLLEVRGSTRLSKSATLTAVRVDGKDLLLGVTDHTVTLLTSEPAGIDAAPAVSVRPTLLAGLRRPGSAVPDDAVAAALAALRGESPLSVTDGPVALAGTDARYAEERPCADPAVA